MASAQSSQAISGAAQGAAMGAVVGGTPGALIGGGIGFIGGLFSGSSADRQFKNQMAWAKYNNIVSYNAAAFNVESSMQIAMLQAGFNMSQAGAEAAAARAVARYNANIIGMTLLYNTQLATEDLYRVWEAESLDLTQLEIFRAREQGVIIADQSASGTVIGEGSNADVVISQQTQRELDKTIIMQNADIAAADIQNKMAQGVWQGEVAIQQTLWEGEMSAYMSTTRAAASNASMLGTTFLQGKAAMWSADSAFQSGQYGIAQSRYAFSQQQTQNLVSGLFKAGGTLTIGHFANKFPGTKPIGGGPPVISGPQTTFPSQGRINFPSAGTPGTSLAVA